MKIRERNTMDPSTSKIEYSYTFVPESRGEHVLLGRLFLKAHGTKHLFWDVITIGTVLRNENETEKIEVNSQPEPPPNNILGQVKF